RRSQQKEASLHRYRRSTRCSAEREFARREFLDGQRRRASRRAHRFDPVVEFPRPCVGRFDAELSCHVVNGWTPTHNQKIFPRALGAMFNRNVSAITSTLMDTRSPLGACRGRLVDDGALNTVKCHHPGGLSPPLRKRLAL